MSSVTRLRLLSRSLLNVSCQKRHTLLLTLAQSFMEFAGRPRPSEAYSLLAVPSLSSLDVDVDEDEGDFVIGIRPKSSPIPSRRSSDCNEDSEPEPPPLCGSRRVSFADAKGLSLVQVKEFDTRDVPKRQGFDSPAADDTNTWEYYLSPLTFFLSLPSDELSARVREQKIELESVELLPGTAILKGVVRVLNISYSKSVFVRTTFDNWCNHFDLLTEYIPDSSDGVTDSFLFKLTLVPPLGDQGSRVDFCLRCETPVGTFWANNDNKNYVLVCYRRMKGDKERGQRENVNKKSCLKTVNQSVSTVENISLKQSSSLENISTDESTNQLEEDRIKAQKIKEEEQILLMESRQNTSRRRQRKAARMARVKDYFAQRDEEGDSDRDESPPEIKQATRVERPEDKHVCVQENGESECPRLVSEACKTCSQPVRNAAPNHACSERPEKPDLGVLAQGESAADGLNKPLHSAGQAANQENIGEFLTKAQEPDTSYTCNKNAEAGGSEGLDGHSNRVAFGTVVAPLYDQVFRSVLGENPNEENTVNTEDFNCPSKAKQTGDIVPQNAKSKTSKMQGNVSEDQESDNPFLDTILTTLRDKKMLKCADLSGTDTSQNQQHLSGDASERLGAVNSVLVTDLVNPQTSSESEHLQETARGQKRAFDLHGETTAEPLEGPCEQFLTAETSPTGEADDVYEPFQSPTGHAVEEEEQQPPRKGENKTKVIKEDDAAVTQVDTALSKGKPLQESEGLNPNKTSNTVSNELVSPCEAETIKLTSPETSQEEPCSIEEEMKGILSPQKGDKNNSGEVKVICEAAGFVISNQDSHADTYEGTTDKNAPDKTKYHVADVAVPIEDEAVGLTDNTEVKNLEIIAEEGENSTLSDDEGGEPLQSKAEDEKTTEKDPSERNEEKLVVKGAAEEVQEDEEDNMAVTEDREWRRQDETAAVLVDKEAKLEDVRVFKANTGDNETETETRKMTDFVEMQQASIEKTSVREEEEMEKYTEMDLNCAGEAGEKQENRTVSHQKKIDYRGEIPADETAAIDADSYVAAEGRGDERGCFEERSDVAENKAEEGLSALPSDELEVAKESTKEGAWIQADSLRFEHASRGRSPEAPALENASTDEPLYEQTSPSSSESDSGDEVELYMHCLRAADASRRARKVKSKDVGLAVSRGKLQPTTMPPISESLDENVPLSGPQEKPDDTQTAATNGQDNTSQGVQRWTGWFSCCSVSKALLYATLLVIFVVVAYYYDFLACFGLYLLSIIWLCCQGEREPVKNNDRAD
ncbi:protein phosphatase 1 regulatory subunit 3A [Kryptolebias marmoratus]|uniref:Protein phosphatase 1 regulatory subunit 3A-like n=1 Tax=Kryptolebias marmoratus TaxID=37003 RepID=A0A3Q3FKQ5_KRYMA|nr:protein phosphatase 1 regulatory subunit 3A [Kryptolebias marmoratus]